MKKLLLTLTLVAALCYPHVKATQTIVKPGDATLGFAIAAASNGDTLVLKNDSAYRELDTLVIKMKITIKAQRLRKLPGLDGMPHLYNDGKIDPFFKLYSNAELILIGIDVNNQTSMDIIRAADKDSTDGVFSVTIDRCRLHNCLFTEKEREG
jgi:hypothetical protein